MSNKPNTLLRYVRSLAAKQASGASSDRQLLQEFLTQRSETSFAALVRRHGPMVLSVCRRVLRNHHDAEDAFQAAFLVFARKAASIYKHESVSSFLHGVAYRVAANMRVEATRRAARERSHARPPFADPCDDITWRELRAVLDEELSKLPEQHRAPLVLCYLEGKTQDEAARLLGWSKSTFRRRLESGRDRLGRQLTRRGVTLSAALSAPLLADATAQASLSPLLADSTVRAGLASALGNTVSGIVSAQVAALAEGGVASLLTKKASIVAILLLSLTVGFGGLLAHRAVPRDTLVEAPAAPKTPQLAPPSPPARSASKDQAIEIKGRVLDPEGKPLAGASLFLLPDGSPKKTDKSARAATDKESRFRFVVRPADFEPQGKSKIVATAKGFGLDWIEVNTKDKSAEITLRLVADDVPIEGRVLDLEGKPVAGAAVQVRSVARRVDGKDLIAFVETVEKQRKEGLDVDAALSKFPWQRLVPAGLDVPVAATTDADGRFRLTEFGRGRVLQLIIRGPTIGHSPLYALTRNGPAKGWIPGTWGLYGAKFDWLAAPCKPIIGTVRDKRTRKPLAGITVGVSQALWITAKTDNQGRYRILGAAKRKEYDVDAGTMPYFDYSKRHVADTPGLEAITVDFELERGIIVRGRLTEKTTGRPVSGEISYVALQENPHLKDFTDASRGGFHAIDSGRTAADGSFALPVVPGPGLLLVTADDALRFAAAEDKGWKTTPRFSLPHAVVPIDPSEKDPKSTSCDIVLEPARLLKGSVLGPDNRPLAGAYTAGCWPIIRWDMFGHERLGSDAFTAGGLKPGRPRMLAFYHREKKIGKVLVLQGGETKPLNVRLESLGAIAGRVLDAKGRPWSGLNVFVSVTYEDKTYPPEFPWFDSSWRKLTRFETKTDREGKFHIDGLLPGLKYNLFVFEGELVIQPEVALPYRADDLTVKSGKTRDLGDLKSKRTADK
jgi:RNA polymerase sigma factor (sigma-70 family)